MAPLRVDLAQLVLFYLSKDTWSLLCDSFNPLTRRQSKLEGENMVLEKKSKDVSSAMKCLPCFHDSVHPRGWPLWRLTSRERGRGCRREGG